MPLQPSLVECKGLRKLKERFMILKFQYKGSIALMGLLACRIGSPPPPWRERIQVGGRSTATGPPSSPSPARGEGTA
jgi:hypothetical protein